MARWLPHPDGGKPNARRYLQVYDYDSERYESLSDD
jgi:hypothetical protein